MVMVPRFLTPPLFTKHPSPACAMEHPGNRMRRQGRDYSHFTDVDSKAQRGKATCPKLHSSSAAEPGLGDEAPLATCRALSRIPCALESLKPGEVWMWGPPLSERAGGQVFLAHEPSGEGCGVGIVRGQDADPGSRGELSQNTVSGQELGPRDSPLPHTEKGPGELGIEKRLGWTPYPRSHCLAEETHRGK